MHRLGGRKEKRVVRGSMGDSWMVWGFGKAVRDVEDEKIDWSR